MSDIQRADAKARRLAIVMTILAGAVGAALLFLFAGYENRLTDWISPESENAGERIKFAISALGVLLTLPLLVFSGYLWRFGGEVIRAKRFPPPGHRVIRDTPIVQGERAVFRGRAARLASIFLATSALILWLLLWRLSEIIAGR